MTISKIHIENIRGFRNQELDIDLRANCTNIIVAPNGFGKSSISTAFNCAKGPRLIVDEKHKYKNDINLISRLSIEHNGRKLEADSSANMISREFDINVIKSNIEPKAKLPKINGFTIAKPYLDIPAIDLGIAIAKEHLNFSISKYKPILGHNSKLVPNFTAILDSDSIKCDILESFDRAEKLKQVKTSKFFDNVIIFTKSQVGTKISISDAAESRFGAQVGALPHLEHILCVIKKHAPQTSWLQRIIISYIIIDLIK